MGSDFYVGDDAAKANEQFLVGGVGGFKAIIKISVKLDGGFFYLEMPGLGVVRRGGEVAVQAESL